MQATQVVHTAIHRQQHNIVVTTLLKVTHPMLVHQTQQQVSEILHTIYLVQDYQVCFSTNIFVPTQ